MSRKPSFVNPFVRVARKSAASAWPTPERPLDLDSPPRDQIHSPLYTPDHRGRSASQNQAPAPGSFMDVERMEASRVDTYGMPATQASSRTPRFSNVGVQVAADGESGGVAPTRKGSLPRIKEAGRMFLFSKLLGRWAKGRRDSVSSAEPQPAQPSRPVLRPRSPQRPTQPTGEDLSSEVLEWGRYVMEAGQYALAPLPAPAPSTPLANNVVPFPKMVSTEAASMERADVRRAPIHSSRPPLPGPPPPLQSPSCPRSQAPSSASPPPSTAPSPYESSKHISRYSSPSSVSSINPDDGIPARKIGVSPQQPQYPRTKEAYWTVVQTNNIHVPSLRETKWLTAGVLGCGGFALVYHVFNVALQRPCAMKVVRFARGLPESACAGLINELKVLALLGEERENCSPFVLQPFMVDGLWAWRSTRGNLHIVTDVCGGGSLTAYRFRLSYPSLVLVIAEIVLGLHWLHEHGIVHHDVKPGNVMVSASGHCVLGDFGGAQFLDHRGKLSRNSDSCMVMTTQFAAPEILVRLDDGQVKEYDEAVDYWSLGATIVSMVLEEDYLPGASEPAFMEFRVDKIQTQLRRRNMPDDLEDLVMDLLRMDPARRCRYPAIMQQPIFYHTNWQDVENQAQAAIPALRDIAANAHGWEYPTPKIHKSNEATVDFLAALREQRLSLAVDDSYDVDRHNAKMTNCLSLGYPF